MFCCKNIRHCLFTACLVLAAQGAVAEHVIGIGADIDTEDGRAFSALASVGIGQSSWLSGGASYSASRAGSNDVETVYIDASFDHHFKPLGVRVGAAYWGDPDLLDSKDVRASVYWKNDLASLSIDFERRAFDLTIRTLTAQPSRSIAFDADGIGLSARWQLSDNVGIYASGMRYDYSRDISLQPSADVVRVFAQSRLSMVNSLLDDRVSGGIEFNIGSRVLDFRVATWRTAVFDDRVDSLGVGLLMPATDSSDIEFRVSTDDVEFLGRSTLFSVFLYLYGN